MRVLVTGGAGYIGRHICEALVLAGHSPTVFDNFSTGRDEVVQFWPLFHGDVLNERALRDALSTSEAEAVIHCAAWSDVGEGEANPAKYRENVLGAIALANVVGDLPVVFSSSAAVYGDWGEGKLTEGQPLDPVNHYGRSKLAGEMVLPNAMRLRYFNVAGGSGDKGGHLIPRALRAIAEDRPFRLNGDGTCVRDFVAVEDVAQANVLALEALASDAMGYALNICSGVGHSVSEVLARCEAVTGRKLKIERGPKRQGDPSSLIGSPFKADAVLGWNAKIGLDEMIASAWEDIRGLG